MPPKGAKRATSAANVGASRTRLSRELGGLQAKEDKIQFQNDLAALTEDIKANPGKLRIHQTVNKMNEKDLKIDKTCFNPDLAGKSITRCRRAYNTVAATPSF